MDLFPRIENLFKEELPKLTEEEHEKDKENLIKFIHKTTNTPITPKHMTPSSTRFKTLPNNVITVFENTDQVITDSEGNNLTTDVNVITAVCTDGVYIWNAEGEGFWQKVCEKELADPELTEEEVTDEDEDEDTDLS